MNPLNVVAVPVESAVPAAPIANLSFTHLHLPAPTEISRPYIHAEVGRYRLRLAAGSQDREAICRLRFRVFNLELGEGLESSYETGLDTDPFDACCEHLIVENTCDQNPACSIVGTYRMQSGAAAASHIGYYSAQEFELSPYEPLRAEILELGRACIVREHRTPEVLTLLWRGIAQYASDVGLRYLMGCSSLTSKNPAEGWDLYRQLEPYRVSPEFATRPTDAFACPADFGIEPAQPVCVPRLLKTYLAMGARIAAPPAWDRAFGTIDFLTWLDFKLLSSAARSRFLAPLTQ